MGIIDPQGRTGKEVEPQENCPTLRAQTHGNDPQVAYGFDISGYKMTEGTDTAHTLNANDQRKPIGEHKKKTMVAVKVKEATKKGYAEAHVGDSINLSVPDSKTRRGRIGGGMAQTLDTQCNQGVIETMTGTIPNGDHPGQYIKLNDECTVYAVWYEKYQCYVAIRKLLPIECFRLQGWDDEYFRRAEFVNSDSQLYRQAGNGVTVPVVQVIGEAINEYYKEKM